MKAKSIFALTLLGLFLAASVLAQPGMINYQGKLTDNAGVPVSATVSIVFSIYGAATGGTPLWTETQSSVVVQDGIYNVLLGSTTSIPDAVFDGGDRWLGVKVGADSEMSPRQRIASVGYAINSDMVDGKHATEFGDGHSLDAADGSPTDAVYVDNNGNVGIGTTPPDSKLEVAGQVKITGGSPGEGKVLTSDSNGLASWQALAASGVVKMANGTYIGNGASSNEVNFSTAFEPKFGLIKREGYAYCSIIFFDASGQGQITLIDGNPNDATYFNVTADPDGFTVGTSDSDINGTGVTYYYTMFGM